MIINQKGMRIPMIVRKSDEAMASSASIVATAMSTTRHNMEKYNYVMRYCPSAHAHVLLRTI